MTDKWGRRLFKAGAVMLVLLGLAHSLSLFQRPVPANDTEKQLLELMANYKFNLMGSSRSMDDLIYGFSVAFMLAAFDLGVFDLLLSRERAGLLKRVAGINTIWLARDDRRFSTVFLCGANVISRGRAADLCAGLAKAAYRGERLGPASGTTQNRSPVITPGSMSSIKSS